MSDPNSTSPDILSDGPVKDILRPAVRYINRKYFNVYIQLHLFHEKTIITIPVS
jgi:hypothetical protein